MKPKVPILISSMKKSPRRKFLTKKLRDLNIKYKIFNGISGKNSKERKIIYDQYDRSRVFKYLGRDMGFNEIGAGYTWLRIFKYAVKKNLKNIIIFGDDFYPSSLLKKWIEKRTYFKGSKIIHFHCDGIGFLKKKKISCLNNKFKVYYAKTHLTNFGAAQVTIEAMRNYLKVTNGMTIGVGDYPFNLFKNKIQLMQVIPFLGYPDDRGFSYLHKDRKKKNKGISFLFSKKIKKIIEKNFSPNISDTILNILRGFYYLLFIPFIFRKIKNYNYYNDIFFQKNLCRLINFFFQCYIDVKKVHNSESSYPDDLKKYYLK
jgi:GR25 family glycosyltransferase involved in LPS biosynthesis